MALVHRVGWEPDLIQRNRWFWPLAHAASRFAEHTDWPRLQELDAMYAEMTADANVKALRFGPNVRKQDKRLGGRVNLDALYDARITMHGDVPSREGDWHDFFNALCFATFPRAKLALHARQYAILEARVGHDAKRLPGSRTREQDALTLFDEGGVVVAADELAYAALTNASPEARRDQLLELTSRSDTAAKGKIEPLPLADSGGRAVVVPFGHALFEHLIEGLPCPAGCTQLLVFRNFPVDADAVLSVVDGALEAVLTDSRRFLSPRDSAQVVVSLR